MDEVRKNTCSLCSDPDIISAFLIFSIIFLINVVICHSSHFCGCLYNFSPISQLLQPLWTSVISSFPISIPTDGDGDSHCCASFVSIHSFLWISPWYGYPQRFRQNQPEWPVTKLFQSNHPFIILVIMSIIVNQMFVLNAGSPLASVITHSNGSLCVQKLQVFSHYASNFHWPYRTHHHNAYVLNPAYSLYANFGRTSGPASIHIVGIQNLFRTRTAIG